MSGCVQRCLKLYQWPRFIRNQRNFSRAIIERNRYTKNIDEGFRVRLQVRCFCAESTIKNDVRSKEKITGSTVDSEEVEKFGRLAQTWWDRTGEFCALHSMNQVRIPLIRDGLLKMQDSTGSVTLSKPLKGLKVLDVGCGGGILSEPLARLGASVVGLDASPDNIQMAGWHAQLDPEVRRNVTYLCSSVEDLAAREANIYDGVVASEILEHVSDPSMFMKACCTLIKPGGSLFVSTINKTQAAKLLAVIAAERILKLAPVGTHEWDKFMPTEDLQSMLVKNGFTVRLLHGLSLNPLTLKWTWTNNVSVNYALHAVKTDDYQSDFSSSGSDSDAEPV